MTLAQVKKLIHADSITKNKLGQFVARWGYFYRHGRSEEKYATEIKNAIPSAVIIDKGDHWAAFRGGASISRSSHFYVVFTVNEDDEVERMAAAMGAGMQPTSGEMQ